MLFATDIAARGLDFPSVDWVVQLDAPEDSDTYIHRVGRTARYESAGRGLLFLLPSEEEGMVKTLEAKGVKIERIKAKESKVANIAHQLQNLAFKEPEIKYLGQRVSRLILARYKLFDNEISSVGIHIVHEVYLLAEGQVNIQTRRIACGQVCRISWSTRNPQNQVFEKGYRPEKEKCSKNYNGHRHGYQGR